MPPTECIYQVSNWYLKACWRKVRKTRTDGRTDGRTDRRTDGQTDGRTDGRTLPRHNTSRFSNGRIKNCKQVVRQSFISNWFNNLNNIVRNPLLRTYQKIKTNFQQEPYLYLIKEHKHRVALSRLRASSHTLDIECGRHDRPKKTHWSTALFPAYCERGWAAFCLSVYD